ncbi:MAG: hypothetical protein ACSHXD_00220 [Marinosulfonomonas sp.]
MPSWRGYSRGHVYPFHDNAKTRPTRGPSLAQMIAPVFSTSDFLIQNLLVESKLVNGLLLGDGD